MRFAGHLLLCSSTSLLDPMLTCWSKKVLIGQTCELSNSKEKLIKLLGSLSNDDRDGNEKVKTTKGLSQTTSLHVLHAFKYISLPLLHD